MSEPVPGDRRGRTRSMVLAAAIAVAASSLWLTPLGSGLGLDEVGTVWTIQGGPGETVDRALRFQGQSPAYYLVARTSWVALGRGEAALRAPSLLAVVGCLLLVVRLGGRALDRETGLLAGAFFVAHGDLVFAAADARPYGLALVASTAASLLLVRWQDGGRARDGVGYAACAALSVWSHPLFVTALGAHVAQVAWWARSPGGPGPRAIGLVAALTALLIAPNAVQVLSLAGRTETLSFAPTPGWPDLLAAVLPACAAPLLVAAGVLAAAGRWPAGALPAPTRRLLPLLVTGSLVPPLFLFAVASLTPASVFVPRYLLAAAPATVLLLGLGARALPPALRVGAAVVALAITASTMTSRHHSSADWRETAGAVARLAPGDADPVLVGAGFIESTRPEWLVEPERRSWLLAPAAAYPIPGELWPLPVPISTGTVEYLERLVAGRLVTARRFVLVIPDYATAPYRGWLDGRVATAGFSCRSLTRTGWYNVLLYER